MTSYEPSTSFLERHTGVVLLLLIISAVSVVATVISILEYDFNISKEKIYNEIYSDVSCEKLIWEKQWEEKKILKNTMQLKILTKYLVEKRCGV